MSEYKPDGWPTVTPRLLASDVAGLVNFIRIVFGDTSELNAHAPSEMRIGESVIMVSDGGSVGEDAHGPVTGPLSVQSCQTGRRRGRSYITPG